MESIIEDGDMLLIDTSRTNFNNGGITVFGVKKRIYKFYRWGQSEIDANFKIPGQPLYFYYPYSHLITPLTSRSIIIVRSVFKNLNSFILKLFYTVFFITI